MISNVSCKAALSKAITSLLCVTEEAREDARVIASCEAAQTVKTSKSSMQRGWNRTDTYWACAWWMRSRVSINTETGCINAAALVLP